MSFSKNLLKGFVRSAVNQVGRDGGRVISNSIYGGRNYVPVSNITPQQPIQATPQIPDNTNITNKPLSTAKILLFVFLSVFFFPLGNIGIAIYGIVKYVDKTATLEWAEVVPQYTFDRRYKSNRRYIGDVVTKHKIKEVASPEIIAVNKNNGMIALAISLGCALVIGISLMVS